MTNEEKPIELSRYSEFDSFFKSAETLSEREYDRVMKVLTPEAQMRFSQQRKYGGRTIIQAWMDGVEDKDIPPSTEAAIERSKRIEEEMAELERLGLIPKRQTFKEFLDDM